MDYLCKVQLGFKHFYNFIHFNLFIFLLNFIYFGLICLLLAILSFVSLEQQNLPNFHKLFFVIIFFQLIIHLNFAYFISFFFKPYFAAILIQNFYLLIEFFIVPDSRMLHTVHFRNFFQVKYFEVTLYYQVFLQFLISSISLYLICLDRCFIIMENILFAFVKIQGFQLSNYNLASSLDLLVSSFLAQLIDLKKNVLVYFEIIHLVFF